MIENLEISLLADHPEAIHLLKRWFEKEWVSYYGPTGQANADDDLLAYRKRSKLPIGVVP